MKPTNSRTMKRHSKPIHSKMTLKYGGGKPKWYNPKTWKLPKLPKRRRVREGDPGDLIISTSDMDATDVAKVGSDKKTSPPQITMMPLPPLPIRATLNRSGSIGSIHESGSGSDSNTDVEYEDLENVQNTVAELKNSEAAKLAQQQEVPQPTSQNNTDLNSMYVSAETVRNMKAARKKTAAQMSLVFSQIRAMKPQTPTSNKSLTPTPSSSEHTYDVLPARKKSPPEEKLERLPTRVQAATRNSLKNPKKPVLARWNAAMAAQKPASQTTMKSQKGPPGKVANIVKNWGK